MKTITYNLRTEEGENSNEYYHTIHRFSKQVFNKISTELGSTIACFTDYIEITGIEKMRSIPEYSVEILTLGLSWDLYLGASQHTSPILVGLLKMLYQWRSKYLKIKSLIDKVRGKLTSLLVVGKIDKNPLNSDFSLRNFKRLIGWLQATGEFKDEAKRLLIWYRYLEASSKDGKITNMEKVLKIFYWFREKAKVELGKYTSNIEKFLQYKHPYYKNREDVIFCGKEEVEYHLNMVGSEIINWGFKPSYDKTNKKVLLVPGCMRVNNGDACKAIQTGLDITCSQCNKDCHVNKLVKLAGKNNFDVFIVPHSSSFTKWLKKWENSEETGLVAVACLLNLVAGGYEMRELNIPAQCVLLDFCGCRKHWDEKGIETELNEERLLELIQN